jgi:hypothetical protein
MLSAKLFDPSVDRFEKSCQYDCKNLVVLNGVDNIQVVETHSCTTTFDFAILVDGIG